MERVTELWSLGKSFRSFTVGGSNTVGLVSVRLGSGKGSMDISEAVRRFGLREAILVLSGYGREKWYWDITKEEARERLEAFRTSAEKAGFEIEEEGQV